MGGIALNVLEQYLFLSPARNQSLVPYNKYLTNQVCDRIAYGGGLRTNSSRRKDDVLRSRMLPDYKSWQIFRH
jgi:hypothetical protein